MSPIAPRRFALSALFCLLIPILSYGDEPKADKAKADPKTKAVVSQFLTALKAKDADALLKVADIPWLTEDERVVTDSNELAKLWRDKLDKMDAAKTPLEIGNGVQLSAAISFEKDEAARLKVLKRVLTQDDWIL